MISLEALPDHRVLASILILFETTLARFYFFNLLLRSRNVFECCESHIQAAFRSNHAKRAFAPFFSPCI